MDIDKLSDELRSGAGRRVYLEGLRPETCYFLSDGKVRREIEPTAYFYIGLSRRWGGKVVVVGKDGDRQIDTEYGPNGLVYRRELDLAACSVERVVQETIVMEHDEESPGKVVRISGPFDCFSKVPSTNPGEGFTRSHFFLYRDRAMLELPGFRDAEQTGLDDFAREIGCDISIVQREEDGSLAVFTYSPNGEIAYRKRDPHDKEEFEEQRSVPHKGGIN